MIHVINDAGEEKSQQMANLIVQTQDLNIQLDSVTTQIEKL